MSNSDDLSDLLKRAGDVASAAFTLAHRFFMDAPGQRHFGYADPAAWGRHEAKFSELIASITELREACIRPHPEFEPTARAIKKLKGIVQKTRRVMRTPIGRRSNGYSEFHCDLRTAAKNIWDAIAEAEESLSDGDPLDWEECPGEERPVNSINTAKEAGRTFVAHKTKVAAEQMPFDHKAIATKVRDFVRLIRQHCPLKGGPIVETGSHASFNRDCSAYAALQDCWEELQRLMSPDGKLRDFLPSNDGHIVALSNSWEAIAALTTVWIELCKRELTFSGIVIKAHERTWKPGRLPEVDPDVLTSLERAAANLDSLELMHVSSDASDDEQRSDSRRFVALANEIITRIEETQRFGWWTDVAALSVRLEEIRRRIGFPPPTAKGFGNSAFLIIEIYPRAEYAGIVAERIAALNLFEDIKRRDSRGGGFMITRDPLTDSFAISTLWLGRNNGSKEYVSKDAAKTAILVLKRWVRAVSRLIDNADDIDLAEAESQASTVRFEVASEPLISSAQDESSAEHVISIEKWADLGIAIDEDWSVYAFTPCPTLGQFLRLSDGVKLDLPGKRWRKVLQCFARSACGTLAKKKELVIELGYVNSGDLPDDQVDFTDNLKSDLRRSRTTLTATMADLARELRRLVKCEESQVFVSEGSEYRSRCVIRCLIRDESRRICFGHPQ